MSTGAIPPFETMNSPAEVYALHRDTLRDMIAVDHFSNSVPPSIVDQWLLALDPRPGNSAVNLPPEIKGFYGGDLRASIPIELAHDCYKHIVHETADRGKVAKHASRMLVALSLLDLDELEARDANLAGLALWHWLLALVRLASEDGAGVGSGRALADVLRRYERVRHRSTLSDARLPRPGRLKARLLAVARELGIQSSVDCLVAWELPGEEGV